MLVNGQSMNINIFHIEWSVTVSLYDKLIQHHFLIL